MNSVRRALPATFLAYTVTSGFALIAAMALQPAFDLSPYAGDLALMLEAWDTHRAASSAGLRSLATALIVSALLGPFLTMTWLAALAEPLSLRRAIGRGVQTYGQACGVWLLLSVPLALILAALAGLPYAGHILLSSGPNDQTHDLTVVLLLMPGLLLMAVWATWVDMARAALVVTEMGAWRAVGRGWRCLDPGSVVGYTAFLGLALSVTVLGWGASGGIGSDSLISQLGTTVFLQSLVFGRLGVRSAWLARALGRVRSLGRAQTALELT